MRLRTNIDLWGSTLFTALGLLPLACGGNTVDTGGMGQGTSGSGGSAGSGSGAGGASAGKGGNGVGGTGVAGTGVGGTGVAGTGNGGAPGFGGGGGDVAPPLMPFPCRDPVPVVIVTPVADAGTFDAGTPATTGYVQCSGGFTHRPTKQTCPSLLPRDVTFMPYDAGFGQQCVHDTDCTAMPNGYCTDGAGGDLGPGTYCNYGCRNDEECPANSICVCGDPVGHCAPATCVTDSNCGGALLCTSYTTNPGCPGQSFACQTPGDSCGSDQDCTNIPNGSCMLEMGRRVCDNTARCAVGRPFLVYGEERLAAACERSDWHGTAVLSGAPLGAAERALLADQWTRVALMEHASIAAFARFAMQLLRLGAPAELVEAATAAMADETKHARLCFAVASAHRGHAVGPGALPIAGSLDESSLEEVLVTTIREGCIGETAAAIEAAEMRAHATDPWVRGVLDVISQDEARHAELAWRFVGWALSQGGTELRRVATRAFATTKIQARGACELRTESDPTLLGGGIAPESLRRHIRQQALVRVILPCAEAILAAPRGQEARSSQGVPS